MIIERAGKPMAVVIPAYLYVNIQRGRDRLWELIEQAQERNKDVPYEEIQRDVEAAIKEVRREMYAEREAESKPSSHEK